MNAPIQLNSAFLPDVQGASDQRHLAIQRVGVKGVRHPLLVQTLSGEALATVGTWNLDVHLPETKKGTHMSRFIALLQAHSEALDAAVFRTMLGEMVTRLEADIGQIEVQFPFFVRKAAPVSGVTSLLDYEVSLKGRIADGLVRVDLTVSVPVTSLCPCSKEISDYGAHNQRSHVVIGVELRHDLAIEELISIAEEEASCQVYGLLKRPDEKFVTERAYDNPKFVEDLVRDVVSRLDRDARVGSYRVEVENFESIHNHSAFAIIERVR